MTSPDLNTNVGVVRAVLLHNLSVTMTGEERTSNPHDFQPDNGNLQEQLDAHKAACDAFDKGDPYGDAPWGPGTYTVDRPEVANALASLEILESELTQLRKLAGPKIMVALLRDACRYAAVRDKHVADFPHVTAAEYDTFADSLTQQAAVDDTFSQPIQG